MITSTTMASMRGRLRVHSGNGTSFLPDQAFVFSRPAKSTDQAIDLPAA